MPGESQPRDEFRGKFSTPPPPTTPSDFGFCVMTCQGYQDRDHADGHPIYPSMLALDPRFVTMTGDLVYYDSNEPRAVTPALARLHWERMFSLPRLVAMMRNASSYWLKDDHDTLTNDSWPGMNSGELTFNEGQTIFRQQAPIGTQSYRTFRWGRDLQIWFTEGRDFRSPNTMPDGPNKTIWGAAQKAWFKRTIQESDATWKLLISPTPLVGPDRGKKERQSLQRRLCPRRQRNPRMAEGARPGQFLCRLRRSALAISFGPSDGGHPGIQRRRGERFSCRRHPGRGTRPITDSTG